MATTPEIRAAVFDGPGAPFRVESPSRPTLRSGEALVRVSLCTVCGSDLHTFLGRRKEKTPCVLGHEPVGVVEEVAGDVRDVGGEPVRVGDRVVWAVAVSCGACFFCTRGLPQKCESLRKYGHEAITPQCGPVGGLSTHCHLLQGTAIVKVPADLPDVVAAPAGCATATIAAALRVGGAPNPLTPFPKKEGGTEPNSEDSARLFALSPSPSSGPREALLTRPESKEGGVGEGVFPKPSSVVIFGLGMLGLTACAWADALGMTAIACDVSDGRLSQAARFGARHLAKPDALADLVKSLTQGRGADLALELSGAPDASRTALDVLRVGGTAVWVGAVFPTPPVSIEPETIVRRCLTVTGIHNYAPRDLASAVEFLAANHTRFPFAELVSKSFPLAEVNEAFRFAEAERPVRVAVACD
ncbi:alcohol dehydrogenase : Phosphonate catabolism associated alcohol dehydrogenase OS=Planctomyces limnophilus (strain ATCC 43296 / DSM 3776 / IFAM 1008 / 290) GN=Plim_1903 PE=4 SV=1: ADH_N: ADH_zinc_N [Gemmata massiliana]|uniref:alcohol dehydrogenase n=1 Tax=Gemmata massiliana TaxID=1210884 RepID=A0A6P2CSF2_9BACT|nr:zinc-binding dehydrogenase [Gemmata massiliana]VTR91035.1 alcohol dehydrogenase : Phosphonate catabolism associated alcohol dehydrogenase OS=Planctomyces limnophilus (strain ATCC 43296 / DSM 3776 / IFAM 1008 / 290) GN=Plim_1903 PE=4 SV=1: ADH_N: ADH_zinc_N [Gemmata massiliana]